jgi:hypothetical protein
MTHFGEQVKLSIYARGAEWSLIAASLLLVAVGLFILVTAFHS